MRPTHDYPQEGQPGDGDGDDFADLTPATHAPHVLTPAATPRDESSQHSTEQLPPGRHRLDDHPPRRRWRFLVAGAAVLAVLGGVGAGTGIASSAMDWFTDRPSGDDVVATGRSTPRESTDRADRSKDRLGAAPPTSPSGAPQASAPRSVAPPPPKASPTPRQSATTRSGAPAPSGAAWVKPMSGYRVTSCYGMRNGRMHQGIDLGAPNRTPIVAASAGTVTVAGGSGDGYGIKVVISHGGDVFTLYGHASKVLVSKGDRVVAGQQIALEGSTGNSTGPHLHFEVHRGMWNRTNPVPWMAARGVDLGGC